MEILLTAFLWVVIIVLLFSPLWFIALGLIWYLYGFTVLIITIIVMLVLWALYEQLQEL